MNGVWGERARVVRGPRSFEAIQQADSGFDHAFNGQVQHVADRLVQGGIALLDLTVESVIEAAIGLLEQTQPAKQEKSDA